ncbi:hypothetical protein [Streptomyces sp. NPDC092370]|uniref:hypothetical protein n=1 Tax=Streptomyces sp. NPDC092370 TaxID=3366016 RepID=UPI0037F3D06C
MISSTISNGPNPFAGIKSPSLYARGKAGPADPAALKVYDLVLDGPTASGRSETPAPLPAACGRRSTPRTGRECGTMEACGCDQC